MEIFSMYTTKIRFHVSSESLKKNDLRVCSGDKESKTIYGHGNSWIAEAYPDGCYLYFSAPDIRDERLLSSVCFMTIMEYARVLLVEGKYSGKGWSATMELSGGGKKTLIQMYADGLSVEEMQRIYRELTEGKYLPSVILKDQLLTSKQVEEIVLGDDGRRVHWLSVVQSAQDTLLRSARAVEMSDRLVADLEERICCLNERVAELQGNLDAKSSV